MSTHCEAVAAGRNTNATGVDLSLLYYGAYTFHSIQITILFILHWL